MPKEIIEEQGVENDRNQHNQPVTPAPDSNSTADWEISSVRAGDGLRDEMKARLRSSEGRHTVGHAHSLQAGDRGVAEAHQWAG